MEDIAERMNIPVMELDPEVAKEAKGKVIHGGELKVRVL